MNELERYEGGGPLTAADLRAQVNLIQEVMAAVMKEGTHYGRIPGAGDKPTLLKPGAEKIMATFRFEVDPEVEDLAFNGGFRYRVKCKLNWPNGRPAGAGVGEASTDEEKYKWRAVVSEAEWKATGEDVKRIKYRRDGEVKQIRTNPADLANTVLKMAKKRSLVDAVLTVTAASDIFTQDIEDMPGEYLQGQDRKQAPKPPLQEPQKKAAEQPKSESGNLICRTPIIGHKEWPSKKEGGNPTYQIKGELEGNEQSFTTFDKKVFELAVSETGTGLLLRLEYVKKEVSGKTYLNIVSLSRVDPQDENAQ